MTVIDDYLSLKAEADACFEEFPTYQEWLGFETIKEKAQDKHQLMYANDTADLY
jgi:hypothetical protein